jgi:hypothetical protein
MRVSLRLAAIPLAASLICAVAAVAAASHPPASGPDPVAAEWHEWPYKVSCEGGLPFDPDAAFGRETNAEQGDLPSHRALRQLLQSGRLSDARTHDWRTLAESGSAGIAEFAAGRLTSLPGWATSKQVEWLRFREDGGHWEWERYSQSCEPHSLRAGVEATTWTLADGEQLNPSTRRVRIELGFDSCEDIRDGRQRAKPEFHERNGALLMAIWLRPATHGRRCRSLIEDPIVVKLPEKLGKRKLLDGGVYPPRPAQPIVSGDGQPPEAVASRSARLRQ